MDDTADLLWNLKNHKATEMETKSDAQAINFRLRQPSKKVT